MNSMPAHRMRRWIMFAVVAAVTLLFLLPGAGSVPVVLWDESRQAVNAAEMYLHGFSLVTTYEFRPDLWNTKPPLLIWMITALMHGLGPGELALRLPSTLAAVGTVLLVAGLVWKVTRSRITVAIACLILLASPGFFGFHAAATADYDALLTFFTTAYLYVFFIMLHRARPSLSLGILAGLLVAAACLTKSIAGLLPDVGIALYVLLARRLRRPFTAPAYAVAAVIAVSITAAFYVAREASWPGYLAAVWNSELGGRYASTLDGHHHPFYYYLAVIARPRADLMFGIGALVFLTPLGLLFASGRARVLLLYCLCAAAGLLLVISLSGTKLPWYVFPAYPPLAIASALSLRAAVFEGSRRWPASRRWRVPATLGVLAALACVALVLRVESYRAMGHGEWQGRYGAILADLHANGVRHVRIIDGGVSVEAGFDAYSPQLRFYALAFGSRGMTVSVAASLATGSGGAGLVVTCDPALVSAVPLSRPPESQPSCRIWQG